MLLGFVVGSANNLIEGVFLGILRIRDALVAAEPAAIIFALLSPIAVLLAGRWRGADRQAPAQFGFAPLTLLAVVGAYELLYWTAGELVYPYVTNFYATVRTIPPAYAVVAMQVLRSLIFAGAVYPLLRSGLCGSPLVLAVVFSMIAGVAPLLPDNPYMPPDIRFHHAIETSTPNLIFGLVVGFLFSRRRPAAAAHA